jgi:nucleotide-binding universal stress UspA family protein
MFTKILVPTDGTELSLKATRSAVKMAQRLNARIVGMTVVEPYVDTPLADYRAGQAGEYEQRMEAIGRERLAQLEADAKAASVAVETTVARSPSPYEAIIDTARRRKCDVIFMASHGRKGLSAVLLGSETQKVLTHSDIPVMVYR